MPDAATGWRRGCAGSASACRSRGFWWRGDSRALAFELLERAHVGVTPGVDFGAAAEGWLRFCYAVADVVIDEALERREGALAKIAEGGRAPSGEEGRP